ncbi:RNA polymerase III subunit C82 [Pseudocyphellaria aurata]|nr:RNA polymerase III subunit C82 [Pseudocyphellaria aurata]
MSKRVFKELLCYGRLSFPGLLHHTGLTSRQLRHSLTVLIQQHLAYWTTSAEDNTTLYEANQETSYALVRSGKYVQWTEDRYGDFAGGVVSNLLLLGHARVGDLAQAYKLVLPNEKHSQEATHDLPNSNSPETPKTKQVNCETVDHSPTLESLHLTLWDLLKAGLIVTVNESHFRSDADNKIEAEREIPHPKLKWKFKKDEELDWERNIQQKLEDWKHGSEAERNEINSLQRGKKRLLEISESSNSKRQRLNLPLTKAVVGTHGYDFDPKISETGFLTENLVLRINHDKFAVVTRNQRLMELADKSIGTATSKVYAEILRKLEGNMLQCKEEARSFEDPDERDMNSLPQVSTQELAALLQDSTDFAGAIGQVDPDKIDLTVFDHPKKLRRKASADSDKPMEITVVDDVSSEEDEDEIDYNSDKSEIVSNAESLPSSLSITPPSKTTIAPLAASKPGAFSALRPHLLLLCEHHHHFLHHLPRTSSTPEKWAVDFSALSTTLLDITLAQTISARFGPLATRLVNILAARGKLDEKTLTALGLINQKTMRSLLTAMHQSGYLQLQEIPRETNRQPSRTLYLWAWDAERARAKLLEECYATIAKLVRRARVEREQVRETVEKASRTDVVGREDEFLGEGERRALEEWKAREERIWGEVGRLDEVVGIVRDF